MLLRRTVVAQRLMSSASPQKASKRDDQTITIVDSDDFLTSPAFAYMPGNIHNLRHHTSQHTFTPSTSVIPPLHNNNTDVNDYDVGDSGDGGGGGD